MLSKKRIFIIMLSTPWNWSADYIRQTAIFLSKNNKVILYDQTGSYFFIKKKKAKAYPQLHNIRFHRPKYYLPFRRLKLIEKLNRKLSFYILLKKYSRQEKILWIFDPEDYDFSKVKMNNLTSIYDCVDCHSVLDEKEDEIMRKKEKILAENADFFTVNSRTLYQLHRKSAKNIITIKAQGFFVPEEKRLKKINLRIKKPVIGFVGGLNYRLDFGLLIKLIANHPEWNFVFFGPMQKKSYEDQVFSTEKNLQKIADYPNTYFLKSKNRYKVYAAIKNFDIGIIPYNIKISFNKYCYPMKLFEYFYFGKLVISTPIEELKRPEFNKFIKIAGGLSAWEKSIQELLKRKWPKIYKDKQRDLAIANSWEKKIEEMISLIS